MTRKITIFELYFEGAQFGPTVGDSPEEEELEFEAYEGDTESSSGRSPARPVLAAVGAIAAVSTVGYLVSRRFRGDDNEYEFEESDYVEFDESERSDEPVME